jgi:hypothetical protein
VDLHDIAQIVFEHSSRGLKIEKDAREELYNFLYKKMTIFFADVKY